MPKTRPTPAPTIISGHILFVIFFITITLGADIIYTIWAIRFFAMTIMTTIFTFHIFLPGRPHALLKVFIKNLTHSLLDVMLYLKGFSMHEFYDWTALISDSARNNMAVDVKKAIKDGKYWTNSPKYQTNYNVFGTQDPNWQNLKMSFIWSCFAYLQREVQIKAIQSWSFQTSLKYPEDRETLWHHHNHNPETTTVSGVFYLKLPDDVKDLTTSGTEMAPMGIGKGGEYFTEWKTGHWMIFPGKTWHRPGLLQSMSDRYIVAADMEF